MNLSKAILRQMYLFLKSASTSCTACVCCHSMLSNALSFGANNSSSTSCWLRLSRQGLLPSNKPNATHFANSNASLLFGSSKIICSRWRVTPCSCMVAPSQDSSTSAPSLTLSSSFPPPSRASMHLVPIKLRTWDVSVIKTPKNNSFHWLILTWSSFVKVKCT